MVFRIARKEYSCYWCRKIINVGEKYWYSGSRSVFGQPYVAYHLACKPIGKKRIRSKSNTITMYNLVKEKPRFAYELKRNFGTNYSAMYYTLKNHGYDIHRIHYAKGEKRKRGDIGNFYIYHIDGQEQEVMDMIKEKFGCKKNYWHIFGSAVAIGKLTKEKYRCIKIIGNDGVIK
ncbi:MAG: hypothetical protein AB1420_15960 [Bacillota bacterium]